MDYIKKNALQLLWYSEINKYENNYFPLEWVTLPVQQSLAK